MRKSIKITAVTITGIALALGIVKFGSFLFPSFGSGPIGTFRAEVNAELQKEGFDSWSDMVTQSSAMIAEKLEEENVKNPVDFCKLALRQVKDGSAFGSDWDEEAGQQPKVGDLPSENIVTLSAKDMTTSPKYHFLMDYYAEEPQQQRIELVSADYETTMQTISETKDVSAFYDAMNNIVWRSASIPKDAEISSRYVIYKEKTEMFRENKDPNQPLVESAIITMYKDSNYILIEIADNTSDKGAAGSWLRQSFKGSESAEGIIRSLTAN